MVVFLKENHGISYGVLVDEPIRETNRIDFD